MSLLDSLLLQEVRVSGVEQVRRSFVNFVGPAASDNPAADSLDLTFGEAVPFIWTWANATARKAQVLTLADLRRIGRQVDMDLYYQVVSNGAGGVSLMPLPDPRIPGEQVRRAIPANNVGVVPTTIGVSAPLTTPSGTIAARSAGAGSTVATKMVRTGLQTAAGAGNRCCQIMGSSLANNNAMLPGSGLRSWTACALNTVSSAARWAMAGFDGGGASGIGSISSAVNPNTFLNWIGIGRSNEANLQLYHNDGSGTSTQIDLGANFPSNTAGEGYILELYTENGTVWVAQVTRINTGHAASHTLTTNLPATADGGPVWYAHNNTDAVVVACDIVGWWSGQLRTGI